METKQRQKLQEVMNNVNQRWIIRGIGLPMIMMPDDHYFVERTLIELGLIKADRNMCAHKAYLDLMAEIGCSMRYGTVHNRDFARGARCITTDTYPWVLADTQEGRDFAADMPRRMAIYQCIRQALTEAGIIQALQD